MADFSAILDVLEDLEIGVNPRLRFSGSKITACFRELSRSGFIRKEFGRYRTTDKGRDLLTLTRRKTRKENE